MKRTSSSLSLVAVAASALASGVFPVLALSAAISLPACATLGAPKGVVPFRVAVNVPDATIWVDDQLVGSAKVLEKDGTFLRAGFHRVEVRHPDYYSYFAEVTPKQGEPVLIHAELHPLLQ